MKNANTNYERPAAHYDARWSFYVRESIRRTLGYVEVRSGQRLLDVGCGTGQLLAAVAAESRDVSLVGVDPSARMLAIARTRVASARLEEGAADSLPVDTNSIDWLICTSVLHCVPDPFAARREFRRVLRPGGTLVLTDWSADFLTMRLQARWSRITDQRVRHVYTALELQALLVAGGFDVTVETYKINWYWGLMTARAVRG